MTVEDLSSTFEAESGGRSQWSISAKPFHHNAPLALSPHDEPAVNDPESSPDRDNVISKPGVEIARKDQRSFLTSDDSPDPVKTPASGTKPSSACISQGSAKAPTASRPVMAEVGLEPTVWRPTPC